MLFCCITPEKEACDEIYNPGNVVEPWVDCGLSRDAYDQILSEFMFLDANGDRKLSRKEFEQIAGLPEFLGMKLDDVEHLFDNVDLDHNGFITQTEFVRYMAERKDHGPLPAQVDPQKLRLEENLRSLGFEMCTVDGGRKGVDGDGNCLFYSLSWELYSTVAEHAAVRRQIIEYLRGPGRNSLEAFYAPVNPSQPATFNEYLDYMAKDQTWGDNLTLQAAANLYNKKIHVLTADRFYAQQRPLLIMSPYTGEGVPGKIWLSFAAQHYSPIKPTASTPAEFK